MKRLMAREAGLLVEWGEIERKARADRFPPRTSRSSAIRTSEAPARGTEKAGGQFNGLRRELHDTVLQDLLCLSFGLNGVGEKEMVPEAKEEVAQLQETARRAYEHLRELLDGQPQATSLPPRGMREVLTTSVRSFKRKTGADIELQMNSSAGGRAVSGEVARETELIVHEALFNAWKHGRARSLKVVLAETADIVWVRVLDDGRGFDPAVAKPGHYGLQCMRERAEAIGARLGISSAPGKGTCVNLYLPSHHPATTH